MLFSLCLSVAQILKAGLCVPLSRTGGGGWISRMRYKVVLFVHTLSVLVKPIGHAYCAILMRLIPSLDIYSCTNSDMQPDCSATKGCLNKLLMYRLQYLTTILLVP